MPIPLSLYIHWPWCLKKCPYCDFNSYAIDSVSDVEAPYIEAILCSLEEQLEWVQNREIHSVFIGGGTPSLISDKGIGEILSGISRKLVLEAEAEITLEANPGTFDKRRFRSYKDLGITRLSVGIQSFNDEFLRRLGRVHDARMALKTATAAAEIFDNFNLDLMFGLPGQSLLEAENDCLKAISFSPTHLSCYQLTLEPNTYFAKYPPKGIPGTDLLFEMSQGIARITESCQMRHYEVSAYAKPGFQCEHNLNYWQYGDYLALGPGAHGKVTLDDKLILRFENFKSPISWLETIKTKTSGLSQKRHVPKEDIPFEFMLDALRLRKGVPVEFWKERTGLPLNTIKSAWEKLLAQGLVEPSTNRLCTTEKGWSFLNEVLMEFLP